MIYPNIGSNWPNGFRREEFKKKSLRGYMDEDRCKVMVKAHMTLCIKQFMLLKMDFTTEFDRTKNMSVDGVQ